MHLNLEHLICSGKSRGLKFPKTADANQQRPIDLGGFLGLAPLVQDKTSSSQALSKPPLSTTLASQAPKRCSFFGTTHCLRISAMNERGTRYNMSDVPSFTLINFIPPPPGPCITWVGERSNKKRGISLRVTKKWPAIFHEENANSLFLVFFFNPEIKTKSYLFSKTILEQNLRKGRGNSTTKRLGFHSFGERNHCNLGYLSSVKKNN